MRRPGAGAVEGRAPFALGALQLRAVRHSLGCTILLLANFWPLQQTLEGSFSAATPQSFLAVTGTGQVRPW